MVYFFQKSVISKKGCCSIRYIQKTQSLLRLLSVFTVTTILLLGCARSEIQSLLPDQTTQESTFTLGQIIPQPATIPIQTILGQTLTPDSTVQNDQSNIGNLNLRQRSPGNWEVIVGGASGTLTYNLSGPRFVFDFSGERLETETLYSLIYYAASDVGPLSLHSEIPGALLAEGMSDSAGTIYLKG
jgi:hypothetical protein